MDALMGAEVEGISPASLATFEKGDGPIFRGWIVYDAECALCVAMMGRVRRLFESRGFRWLPLQAPGSAALLGVDESAFATRMHVLNRSGRLYDNADALGVLCRTVWWLWPLGVLLSVPGFREAGRIGYNWFARHRQCLSCCCGRLAAKRKGRFVLEEATK